MSKNLFLVAAKRTPFGAFGGALKVKRSFTSFLFFSFLYFKKHFVLLLELEFLFYLFYLKTHFIYLFHRT